MKTLRFLYFLLFLAILTLPLIYFLTPKGKLRILVDPEQAPPRIREKVMMGYRLMTNTPRYASDWVGDKLSCTNCHFQGGNTWGGRNGSMSLVGVSEVYPRFNKRAGKEIDLATRIDGCFQRSLNGKPLPHDSKEMEAFLAYFEWISSPVKGEKEFPWLGLKPIRRKRAPDINKGKALYVEHCASCHGIDGAGTHLPGDEEILNIPPLWGDESFNDGAGMHRPEIFAAFIHANMPYRQPILTEQEAFDIAEYVLNQPRPHYEAKK